MSRGKLIMYSLIINWHLGWERPEEYRNDRQSYIQNPERAAKFKELVDAGLVSNTFGPNCYIRTLEDSAEVCNATWQTLEAAQQWLEICKPIPYIIGMKIVDESGTTLVSFPE